MYFYANDGEPLTYFSIPKLLQSIDDSVIDHKNSKIAIIPYSKRVFLVAVENFLFAVYIEFDRTRQIHVMDLIKSYVSLITNTINFLSSHPNSNEIYVAKLPKGRATDMSHDIYKFSKRTIQVIGETRMKSINCCFDETLFSRMQEENISLNVNFLSDNINMKLLRNKS